MTHIAVAGASGNLGNKIVAALLQKGAIVHAIVRRSSNTTAADRLREQGAKVFTVSAYTPEALLEPCTGTSCVVSALAGLKEVIIDAQQALAQAAMQAGVPRFIPSDFSLDFTNLVPGKNRNLDLRRDFHTYLAGKPIVVTSIFNGAFMELLTGDMPLIVHPINRILYYGNPDQLMDFTHTNDVAHFTAAAALSPNTPRYLHIFGDRVSSRQVASIVGELKGKHYGLLRPGGIGLLNTIISVAKKLAPGANDLYPAWQGMQYMRDMMEGRADVAANDNERFGPLAFTNIKTYLQSQGVGKNE